MITKQFIDKSEWAEGPWSTETDYAEWMHADVFCRIIRCEHLGHLCGYVGLELSHPWANRTSDRLAFVRSAHGGVNFSGQPTDERWAPIALWWVGFDCGHIDDVRPLHCNAAWAVYRDFEYVKCCVEQLACEAAAYRSSPE